MTTINDTLDGEGRRFEEEFPTGDCPPEISVDGIIKCSDCREIDRFKSFLSDSNRRVLGAVREKIKGMRKTCEHVSYKHCTDNACYIWQPDGYNRALDDLLSFLGEGE